MKFLSRLYRFFGIHINYRRVSIFLSVSLLAAIVLSVLLLVPGIFTAILFTLAFIFYVIFVADCFFGGEALDAIEFKVVQFQRFK